MCLNLFVPLFLVTPFLEAAVQPCMEWTPAKRPISKHQVSSKKAELKKSKLVLQGITIEPAPEKMCFKKNFLTVTGKYLCQSVFLNKVAALSQSRYFPVNFAKFFRTVFLLNTSGDCFFQILLNLKKEEQNTHTLKMNRK